MTAQHRLAILHTTPVTIDSLGALCKRLLPGVKVNHYLDDSILQEINERGAITPAARFRFQALAGVAAAAQPEVILSACSSVGGLLEEAREIYPMPLVRIDEPMAQEAAARPGSIAVCATVASTLEPTFALIRRYIGQERKADAILLSEAGALLAAGDQEAYLALIASRLGEAAARYDTVVLAQASMAKAVERMPQELHSKFLTSPESGISALRSRFDLK